MIKQDNYSELKHITDRQLYLMIKDYKEMFNKLRTGAILLNKNDLKNNIDLLGVKIKYLKAVKKSRLKANKEGIKRSKDQVERRLNKLDSLVQSTEVKEEEV